MQPLCAHRPSNDLPYISTIPITHAGATPATKDLVLSLGHLQPLTQRFDPFGGGVGVMLHQFCPVYSLAVYLCPLQLL